MITSVNYFRNVDCVLTNNSRDLYMQIIILLVCVAGGIGFVHRKSFAGISEHRRDFIVSSPHSPHSFVAPLLSAKTLLVLNSDPASVLRE